ncbi:hypothetical protein O1611_g5001 [Lasiodiplodia mahajangana]|uniref:Uncharacterized protein n=1 Tax=Lasiodiplodia mahajangana TaxID=1108764 RepID=A0ACC2JMS0_9PEZI|nr:hypothetical protein O1611_g5001 [Lasiodiplodia mahajangana]
MGNNSATSCLSAEPHDDAIKDPLVHYFGCTQLNNRHKFLEPEHRIWKDEKTHQRNLEAARAVRGTSEQEIERKAEDSVEATRKRWAKNFAKEIRRIRLLRKTLEDEPPEGNLVLEVKNCREAWWNSKPHRPVLLDIVDGIAEREATRRELSPYMPEKDVSVGIIQFENSEPFNERCEPSGQYGESSYGRNELIWGKFPDQKTSVQSLLYEGERNNPERNLLHKDRIPGNSDRIRYFHIPSNNMILGSLLSRNH